MDFVSNIWKKAPFKGDSVEASGEVQQATDDTNSTTNLGQSFGDNASGENASGSEPSSATNFNNLTNNITEQVTGGVNYVSNILKSTFRSDSTEAAKDRKDSLDTEQQAPAEEDAAKKDSFAGNIHAGATNFMSNVWKTTSLFKTDSNDQKARKASQTSETGGEQQDDCPEKSPTDNVSQKALDSAKNIGSFLFNVANKAGHTVTTTAKQIRQTVENTSLFADFSKEQQEFIREHGGNIQPGEAPWIGAENEPELKEQILTLSQDKRNFVRSPPTSVQFEFDFQQMLPVALTLLKEDENLNKMRFDIVPKLVNEETFWRNYFYRVSLIKQSTSLGNLNKGAKGWGGSSSSSSEGPDDPSPTTADVEFVSDSLGGDTSVTAEDLQKGLRQLGVDRTADEDQQWEDEITKDLQEFEVVNNDLSSAIDAELEEELSNLK